MTSGFPWQGKGVRREVLDSAREAARRAGMSVEEWLDRAIAESARGAGIEPAAYRPSRHDESAGARGWHREAATYDSRSRGGPFADVSARLDALSRQLDHLSFAGDLKPRHRSPDVDDTSRLINDAFARLDRKIDRLVEHGRSAGSDIERRVSEFDRARLGPAPDAHSAARSSQAGTVDQALAEIEAAQRLLDNMPPGGAAPKAPMNLPRAPTQGLSDLEQQLRQINTRLDTMPPCGIDSAVETLRDDLAEIGIMLKDAMPRQAIEALESEIRSLASRIDNDRRPGVDNGTIMGIERSLAEVRDALRGLAPAESLTGFGQAVQGLSQKIDRIAGSGADSDALKQLEGAIVALRGVVSHVASNDTLAQLSEDVRKLSAKVDQVTDSDAFLAIERRIAAMADALQQSRGTPAENTAGLETVVRSLTEKVDQLQATRSENNAFGYLDDRLMQLAQKLDASDARLDSLSTIERGLGDLLSQIENQRTPVAANSGIAIAETDGLKRDVQRTQDSLESVHGTLGHVVDRLALIEAGIREAARTAKAAEPARLPELTTAPAIVPTTPLVPEPAPRLQDIALSPPVAPSQSAMFRESSVADTPSGPRLNPSPAPDRRPIDPNLPPDHPLEPGATRTRGGNSPAERIAASEAALENVRPPVIPDPAGKSNFIAAARRAAQAAVAEEPLPRAKRVAEPTGSAGKPATSSLGTRIRKLMVGASVVLIILGAAHFAAKRFWFSPANTSESTAQTTQEQVPAADPPSVTAPAAPERQSMALPSSVAFPASAPGFGIDPERNATGALFHSVPQASVMPSAGPALSPAVPTAAARTNGGDRLPAGIGGSSLRAAAANGDAAAEYEIATRFAEGRGVPQNLTEAAAWFERAANKGLVPAQFRLGGLYEKGNGVRKNLEIARRLYTAAADAGHAKAMHNLAVLYAEGVDGKPNYATAARWFRKAADHGVTDAQYNLAILYARGIGVETNMAEAFKWFALASRDGDRDAAKKRDDVASRLDKQSLAAAMAAAQSFRPQAQPDAAINVKTPPGGWDAGAAPATAKRNVTPKADAPTRRATP